MTWCDVHLFHMIPEILQMDLRHEVYSPIVLRHPFFHQYNEHHLRALRFMIHQSMDDIALVADQELFNEGQLADKMYFVINGSLLYAQTVDSAGSPLRAHRSSTRLWDWAELAKKRSRILEVGDWLCEAAIWVRWLHRGDAAAVQFCTVIRVHAGKLHKIVQQYQEILPHCCRYVELLLERANMNYGDKWFSDSWGDFDSIQELAQQAFEEEDANMVASTDTDGSTPSRHSQSSKTMTSRAAALFTRRTTSNNTSNSAPRPHSIARLMPGLRRSLSRHRLDSDGGAQRR